MKVFNYGKFIESVYFDGFADEELLKGSYSERIITLGHEYCPMDIFLGMEKEYRHKYGFDNDFVFVAHPVFISMLQQMGWCEMGVVGDRWRMTVKGYPIDECISIANDCVFLVSLKEFKVNDMRGYHHTVGVECVILNKLMGLGDCYMTPDSRYQPIAPICMNVISALDDCNSQKDNLIKSSYSECLRSDIPDFKG